MAKQERLFQRMDDRLPLPQFTLTIDGRVEYANESAQILMSSFGTIEGKNLFQLFPECAHMAEVLERDKTDYFQQYLTWHLPRAHESPSAYEAIAYFSPIPLERGSQARWQLLLVEVTHWRSYWRHDQQQQSRQEQVRTFREWAHEINNPLGGVLAATQWWQKSTLPKLSQDLREETEPIINMILQEVNRLRARMGGLLQTGETHTRAVNINVHQPLELALRVFAHEFPEVRIMKDYDVSAPVFHAVEEHLQQIFDNLCRNAGQALRRAQIIQPKLHIRSRVVHAVMVQGNIHRMALAVEIEDNGPGMNVSPHTKIPETIYGHGLGLSIVSKLVAALSAELILISEKGKTQWTLLLPYPAL